MHWNSLQDFLAMGGYAFFVWSSVLVTAGALLLEVVLLNGRRARLPLAHTPTDTSLTKSSHES